MNKREKVRVVYLSKGPESAWATSFDSVVSVVGLKRD